MWVEGEESIKLRRDGVLDQDSCVDREKWMNLRVGVDSIAAEWI